MNGGGSTRPETILIVDDDPSIRAAIAMMLSEAGYVACEAESGPSALCAARVERPALVLLDVNLPGMCGYEVHRLLRDEFGDELPVIFVSGERTESFDRVGGLLLGANDYVVKPFFDDELLARIQGVLGRRQTSTARSVGSCLTPRELQILRLLAAGLGPDGIARRLVISPKTVGAHVERIYVKLAVQTRAQAVAVAYRDRLLESEIPEVIASTSPKRPAVPAG